MTPDQARIFREARERVLLTRPEAATKLGMSESGLWRIEQGLRDPNFDTLEKLVNTFNIDARLLFPGKHGGLTGLTQMFSELRLDAGLCVMVLVALRNGFKNNAKIYEYLKITAREMNLPENVLE